jgi:hypothetical protein
MNVTTKFLTEEIFPSKAETLTVKVYDDGVAVEPTAATYEVYDGTGNLISSGTASTAAEEGETIKNVISASVGATDFTEDEVDCHVEWQLTINSESFVFINLFDVVNYKIHNNVSDEDLLTYFPNLANELTSTQSGFDTQIQRAFTEVKLALKEKGIIPRRMLDSEQVKHLIILKAFEIIFFAFPRTPESVWQVRYDEVKKKFEEALKKLILKYDDDESGVPEGEIRFSTIRLQR